MISTHSIFSRQWWVVVLRVKRALAVDQRDQIVPVTKAIAGVFNGTVLKSTKSAGPGAIVASRSDPKDTQSIRSMLLLQTESVYFPLAEESLEIGTLVNDRATDARRDFPRRIISGKNTLFQYPLLIALSDQPAIGPCLVLASPYYLLKHELYLALRQGHLFSDDVRIDVPKVFKRLGKVKLKNGAISMSSGRMIITGIEFLRSAVFFGDNVIASPLYGDLLKRPKTTVDPKDCRLHRSYEEQVGGNRRVHVCWFDPNGNFRFTPGGNADATLRKFLELLNVLIELDVITETETPNSAIRKRTR